ncbi:unnamed protein product, partial [Mesorhabditis spiculigera]
MDVHFSADEPPGCTVKVRKVTEGSYVLSQKPIIEFNRPDGSLGQVLATSEGVVQFSAAIHKGKELTHGDVVAKLTPCAHHIVIKELCATCGADLKLDQAEETTQAPGSGKANASVSMIHHVPELRITNELAMEICTQDREHMIKARKLILLVDLDQTIIHTTNRPHGADIESNPEIVSFRLYGGVHYTKLRPYTRDFLENISRLYEMHIVTYGQREYAHKIANIIDPDERYFGQRILSRDELRSAQFKSVNLEALFPRGDLRSMIAIIDDRADVWRYSEALIQVKPYRFFKEVGDINAPASGEEPVAALAVNDDDHILEHTERALTQIHQAFYRNYDEKGGEIKDLKVIIKYLKSQVLRNLTICLSGVIPTQYKEQKREHESQVYRLCDQFGAKLVDEVTPEITHLVAVQWGTKKVHEARKLKKPIVTPGWIYACVEMWLKVDEKEFELTAENSPKSSGEAIGRAVLGVGVNDLAPIGKEDVKNMYDEVDELCGDDGDSDDSDGKEDSNDGQTEPIPTVSKPVEVPPQAKVTRKRTRQLLFRDEIYRDGAYEEDDLDEQAKQLREQEGEELDEDDNEGIDYDDVERFIHRHDDDNDEDDSDLDDMVDELEHQLNQ